MMGGGMGGRMFGQGQMPEDGTMPEMPEDGTMPEMPEGGFGGRGQMPGGRR